MTGPQQPYGGGQQPYGGGDWQPPSEQTHYNVSPASGQPYDQGYGQPPVTGQPYDQGYQQYDQTSGQPYDQGYQQPGYDPNYAQPGYGAPMPPPVPPKKKGSPLPWILGGVAVLVVLVLLCGIGIWVLNPFGGGSGGSGGTGSGGSSKGKYDASKVSNLCDQVDPSPLTTAVPSATSAKSPTHREYRSSYSTELSCGLDYESPDSSDTVSSANATFSASYSQSESLAKSSFDDSKKSAQGETGTGHSTGAVTGIGSDAFYTADTDSESADYDLTVLDSNVSLEVDVMLFADGITLDQAKTAATAAAKTTLANMANPKK